MHGEHGGQILEGYRNGIPVLVWRCVCGAKGKGSATLEQAVNGFRKHCGFRAAPKRKTQPTNASSRDW